MTLGPRSCAVCGPKLAGCFKCGAKTGHRHLDVVLRDGTKAGSVAACDVHAPAQVAQASGEANGAPEAATAFDVGDPRKRWLDKTYRQAVAQLRERHREELDELIHEARGF